MSPCADGSRQGAPTDSGVETGNKQARAVRVLDDKQVACCKPTFDVDAEVTFVELAMRTRGLTADADALDRVRRMFAGELTRDEAVAEVRLKYGKPLPPGSGPAQ